MRHYPDLCSTSDWLCRERNFLQPIGSTTQTWVVTRHQYGISALVSQTSFSGETIVASRNVGCFLRLFPRVNAMLPMKLLSFADMQDLTFGLKKQASGLEATEM